MRISDGFRWWKECDALGQPGAVVELERSRRANHGFGGGGVEKGLRMGDQNPRDFVLTLILSN